MSTVFSNFQRFSTELTHFSKNRRLRFQQNKYSVFKGTNTLFPKEQTLRLQKKKHSVFMEAGAPCVNTPAPPRIPCSSGIPLLLFHMLFRMLFSLKTQKAETTDAPRQPFPLLTGSTVNQTRRLYRFLPDRFIFQPSVINHRKWNPTSGWLLPRALSALRRQPWNR